MKMIDAMIKRLSVFAFVVTCFVTAALGQNGANSQLSGTFRLDRSQSDDVPAMVDSIARANSLSEDVKDSLEDQLTAPDTLTIGVNGGSNTVTIASSASSAVTFQADGRSQAMRQDDGSQVNVTASLRNGVLRLSRVGQGSSYSITFAAEAGGSALRVTRMITTDYITNTIYADSYYTRDGKYSSVDPVDENDEDAYSSADSDGGYSSSDPNDGTNSTGTGGRTYPTTKTVNGRYVVPKGVEITGTLDNKISTKASQENDRFTMTVDSPDEFRGAVVEGYLSGVKRTGRVLGSSTLTFNFETIRLASGEVYDFAGVLKGVTDSTGKVIKVGDEGDAKGKSKTKESIKRGGIGAGIGAVLGAIIGGGKGAIIGATIGGGAGAGSVIAQGRDDIELLPGSQISVESSSPNTDVR